MSRDLTPRELDMLQKETKCGNIALDLKIKIGDKEIDYYSNEDKDLILAYSKLGMFGVDFLFKCKNKGILSTKLGKSYVDEVEKVLNGEDIPYKEFKETILDWYNGKLEPGYDMAYNNEALVEFIMNMLYHVEPNSELND